MLFDLMFIGKGPDMLGLLYDSCYAERLLQAVKLTHQSKQWEEVAVPHELLHQPFWRAHEPIGGRLSGHVFSFRGSSFDFPEDENST